nr:hypothetical protein [Helicobacter rodentium]
MNLLSFCMSVSIVPLTRLVLPFISPNVCVVCESLEFSIMPRKTMNLDSMPVWTSSQKPCLEDSKLPCVCCGGGGEF